MKKRIIILLVLLMPTLLASTCYAGLRSAVRDGLDLAGPAPADLSPSGKVPQSITFDPLFTRVFGDRDFYPGATASSGLPVTYTSSNPAVAVIVDGTMGMGETIRVVAPGIAEITASQAGDATYDPAIDVVQTLVVNPQPPKDDLRSAVRDGFVINNVDPYRFTPQWVMDESVCPVDYGYPCGIFLPAYGPDIHGYEIRAVAYQPWDGKVLIGGSFALDYGDPPITLQGLARLNTDGTLDTSFQSAPYGEVNAIAIETNQADPQESRIYIGGTFGWIDTPYGSTVRKGLARLRSADGAVDASFDPANVATPVTIKSLVLEPDGAGLLVGGLFSQLVGGACGNMARVSLAGATEGTVTGTFSGGTDGEVNAIVLQDGYMVIGGGFTTPRQNLARYKPDGSLDAGYLAAPNATVRALALQADGKVILGGDFDSVTAGSGAQERQHLARLTIDGELDAFSPVADSGSVNAIALQADGRILVAGEFNGIGAGATEPSYFARLKPDGTLDPINLKLDYFAYGLAVQPDGKFLVGGLFYSAGGKDRTHLARFYPNGVLDDDASSLESDLLDRADITTMAIASDGSVFYQGQPKDITSYRYLAKLDQNLNLDQAFTLANKFQGFIQTLAVQPDGYLLVGGVFHRVNDVEHQMVVRLAPSGAIDPDFHNPFNGWASWEFGDGVKYLNYVTILVLLPVGSSTSKDTWSDGVLIPKGTPFEDGMIYMGGIVTPRDPTQRTIRLIRTKKNGEVDPTFNPPDFDGIISALVIQPDNKIVITVHSQEYTEPDKMYRLETNGEIDPTFHSPRSLWQIDADLTLTAQMDRDGQLYIGGMFADLAWDTTTPPIPRLAKGGMVRLNNLQHRRGDGSITQDGSLDLDYPTRIIDSFDPHDQPLIFGIALQADQKVLMTGWFDKVDDGTSVVDRQFIVRLEKSGKIDELDHLISWERPGYNQSNFTYQFITLQPDGKILVGGYLDSAGPYPCKERINNLSNMLRFSNGWGTQELTVSPDGSTITWLRGGTAPEVWAVHFQDAADPAGPWTTLGAATPIPGGWKLQGASLTHAQNRYLRAVGYQSTAWRNQNGALVESIRNYYLKPVLTVTAKAKSKAYGDADPGLDYEISGLVDGDTSAVITGSLAREPGQTPGSYAIKQGTIYAGLKYAVVYNGANLTINPAHLTVKANSKTKILGAEEPSLDFTVSGFVNGDTGAILTGSLRRDQGEGTGIYPIGIGSLSAGPNYTIDFTGATLTILSGAGLTPQLITFNLRARTFGDGDFAPGATASSALPVTYTSSNPAVAAIVGGKIRVVAPGTAEITASQEGDAAYDPAADVTRTLTVNPPPWNGVGFDGTDDLIRVGSAPQLNFGAKPGFTIETWLHLDGTQSDGTGLISKGAGGGAAGYQLTLYQDRVAAEITDGTSTVGVPEGLVGTTILNDGRWHHVALSVDRASSTARLYLDGRVEKELIHATLAVNADNAQDLLVGVDRSGSAFFRGELDEVRLWDSARTRDEIRSSLSQIIDPLDEERLVAYFHLDEGDAGLVNAASATAPERTANGANGSLQGFALAGTGSNWVRSGAFLPLLETSTLSDITSGGATGRGLVYTNYYPATDRGLCWGTAAGPALSDNCVHAGSGVGPFIGAITGLSAGVTYHVRAFAVNEMGTTYGNELTFQAAKLNQTITLPQISGVTYGDPPINPGGTTSSGLPVTYTSSDPAVAVVIGGQIVITGAGTTVITASQPGNGTYDPAPAVPITLNVAKAVLTVTAHNKSRACLASDPAFTFSYSGFVNGDSESALSGMPALSTTAIQTSPAGSYPIIVALGTLQSDDYTFVFTNGTLIVAGSTSQSITFNPMRARTFGDADFDPGATASSGLPVSYASSAPAVASVAGSKIRVVAPGTAEITASQPGDGTFDPAADVVRTLVVNPPPWNGVGFDGADDLIRVGNGPHLNFGAKPGFTIESWLHLPASQPDGTGLVSKGLPGNGAGYQLLLHQDKVAAEVSDGTSTVGVPEGLVGTTGLNDGRWHHVALSVDRSSSTARLYLDGRLEKELSHAALAVNPDNAQDLLVGVARTGGSFFSGELDELRLWDSARTRDEIRNSVSQIIDPLSEEHLVAYFHLDEGDAGLANAAFTTAPERTANGANGSLQGFALAGTGSNWVRSGAFMPLLETSPISATTSTSATGGGLVYPNYYPATDAGLCWGTAANPDLTGSCLHAGSGAGPFVGAITGLTAGVTYHVRAFAVNAMGTAYGNEVTFQAARLDQAITVGGLSRTYGDPPFLPGGASSSGLPVTYTSMDENVAKVVNGEIRITGAGSTVILASQGGNEIYNPAPDVAVPLVVAKAPLTVAAENKARVYQTPNPPFTVTYGGFVYADSLSTVSGEPGLTTEATQASPVGDYQIVVNPAPLSALNYLFIPINGTLSILRSCQQIVFPAISPATYGDPPFNLNASACSGLEIAFSSSNPLVAQVNGRVVTIVGAGTAVITASQAGSTSIDRAPDVSQALVVQKRGQTVTFSPIARRILGDPPFALNAASSSGLPVSYQSSDPSVAAVGGNTVTIVGAGTTVITARQEGDLNHNAALPISQPLTVSVEGNPPVLALSTLSAGAVTTDPVLNIMGSATDASGISSLTVNGIDVTDRAALFSSAVCLATGVNNISVAATDGAGNKTTETVTVHLDATAPVISVQAPADNSVTGSSFLAASGTVTSGSVVTMAVNGATLQSLAVTDGTFSGTAYLRQGVNTIELTASLQGRVSKVKRSVSYAPGKPFVAITEPVEDMRTEQQSLVVKGMAGAEGSEVSVVVDAGGRNLVPAVENGGFQQQIALKQNGETRISASVTDRSGNTSVAYRNIVQVASISGDMNGDGRVDIADAAVAMALSLGMEPVTPQALAHGDLAPLVDGAPHPDGKIDVGDVLVILRRIVGLVEF